MSGAALVAAVQLDSQDDVGRNWSTLQDLARRARDRGAQLIVFPENSLYEGRDRALRHPLDEWGPRLSELARELGATLVPGTLREPGPSAELRYNTLLVYGPDGSELARYRKIHLFDVDVPGGPSERESADVAPGPSEPLLVEVEGLGAVGLTVCYDLRFPELFRALVGKGARTVLVPSSFALGTGKDHWRVLLRARAIENQLHVIAPNQIGLKPNGRTRYGKTMIVDPWGDVLAQARDVAGDVVVAELDFAYQERVRSLLPCLTHRRL
ncbi:MAG TPA: hydrolase [Planctomycetes bacterium]|nr:hydrolase [Planctomycetota bacterium]